MPGSGTDAVPTEDGLQVELSYLAPVSGSTIKFLYDGGLNVTNFVKFKLTTASGTEYHITSTGLKHDPNIFAHFFSGGLFLLANSKRDTDALLVKVDREKNGVKYATSVATFQVTQPIDVYGFPERNTLFGLIKAGQEDNPLVNETLELEAYMSSTAELHLPTTFCVG
jgi:hypothetical protein